MMASIVSVSSCGSSWFLGRWDHGDTASGNVFQYPLADRVGFWGTTRLSMKSTPRCFSILLRIELVFGATVASRQLERDGVSVSSCGSSWFLGHMDDR